MQFIVVHRGRIIGQVDWDGGDNLSLPEGAMLLTVSQAIDLNLDF